ncbi:MAG: preprotein translocase subunit SecG [Proteobacteria bacterium]|nr:preprotein translocase subunit SecG [Pseudomonadota bacterium]
MLTFIYVVFALVSLFLIVTVLIQPGKSGGLGAAFGGGGNTVFGAGGGTPVFRKMTTGAAVIFMLLSLLLSYISLDKSLAGVESQKTRGLDFSAPYEAPVIPAASATPPAAPGLD